MSYILDVMSTAKLLPHEKGEEKKEGCGASSCGDVAWVAAMALTHVSNLNPAVEKLSHSLTLMNCKELKESMTLKMGSTIIRQQRDVS